MLARLGVLLALLVPVTLASGPVTAAPGAHPAPRIADKDCADFANQRDAQLFYLRAGGPHQDPHRLDYEGDGVACETLPCPCYRGTSAPQQQTAAQPDRTRSWTGRVVRVVDGDTVKVRLDAGRTVTVRMIGIDTPEVHGSTECGGARASRWLKKQLPTRTRVRLLADPSQADEDRYGRVLRYVERRRDGRDMNRAQVFTGNATVYVYARTPFRRVGSYRTAQRQAKAARRGIWRSCRG